MKLLYLHQYFNTPAMSGSTRSYEMARRFVEAGHEVHVITSHRTERRGQGSRSWTVTDEAGIQVHWCAVPYSNAMSAWRRLIAFIRFAVAAARRSLRIGGDAVLATSTPLTIALPAMYAGWRLGKPFVFEVRDLWPEVPIALGAIRNPLLIRMARGLELAAYQRARHVIALSAPMRSAILARGIPAQKVTVIPNGADLDLFRPAPECGRSIRARHSWLQDRPLVLYAGTIGFANGIEYLVRLAATMHPLAPEVRFAVIGDGARLDAIRDEARRLGVLGETFFLLRPVPKGEVVQWFGAATVVTSIVIASPAMEANSANKFFDGLAAGRPLVINYEGWQADLLREKSAGIVLPSSDAVAGAELLLRFLRSEVEVTAAGRRARMLAEERFDRDRLAAQLLHVITEVAAS